MNKRTLLLLAAPLCLACDDTTAEVGLFAGDVTAADAVDTTAPNADAGVEEDDSSTGDVPHDTAEEPTDTHALPDWFENACTSNADCGGPDGSSGFCVADANGQRQCTIACVDDCPAEYDCVAIQNVGGADAVLACLPGLDPTCDPCETDSDCVLAGAKCLPVGGKAGPWCVVACGSEGECPGELECDSSSMCMPALCEATEDPDADSDGVADTLDNCTSTPNTDQEDTDQDQLGDVCDTDDDGDGDPDTSDCAPLDAAIGALADEACNGADDDCDSEIDEGFSNVDGDASADCLDTDDDGDGAPDASDCAPLDAAIGALADEACNGADDDCDSEIDEGFPNVDGDASADCLDTDDDGDGDPDTSDCAPLDAAVGALADEACNGVDDDCDSATDEGFPNLDGDASADCVDTDDDGDGDPDTSDCAPLDAAIGALADDACNGVDDDCDSATDEGFPNLDGDASADCLDTDDDGDGDADTSDCAPLEAAIGALAEEACNGVDDDCDAGTDEGFPNLDGDASPDCLDDDDDDDGDPDTSDCAPLDAAIGALATELCNGLDDNCDQAVDEGFDDGDGDRFADCVDLDDDNDGVPDTADSCPSVTSSNTCDDGNACTLGDMCSGGVCQAGATSACNDNNPCTQDTCTAGSCANTIDAGACPLTLFSDQPAFEARTCGSYTNLHITGPTEGHFVAVNEPTIQPSYESQGVVFRPFGTSGVYPVIYRGQQHQIALPSHDGLIVNLTSPYSAADLDGRAIKADFKFPQHAVGVWTNVGDGGHIDAFSANGTLVASAPISSGGFAGLVSPVPFVSVAVVNTFDGDIVFGIYDLQFANCID